VTDIPGLEVAGTIVAMGTGTTGFRVGDEVCALVAGGGYAEYCPAPAGQCLPVPISLSMTEAASLPETFFTVWANVVDRAALKPDEILLVQAAAASTWRLW
jgi:NADPH2:quinone reductase